MRKTEVQSNPKLSDDEACSPEFQIVSFGSSSNLRLKGLRQWKVKIC